MTEPVNNKDALNLPSGFTAVEYSEGSEYTHGVLEDLSKDDVEVWLVKAPKEVDLKALNGQKLKLDGTSRCKCENVKSKYELTHNSSVPKELESSLLLIPDPSHGKLKPCGTKISGFLSISETVTLPEIQYPSVVETKVPFPTNLRLRYVPFGADIPAETSNLSIKKRKKIKVSDNESPRKKKSKRNKHKDGSAEDSHHITKELQVANKKKIRQGESQVNDSDSKSHKKEERMSSIIKKERKRKRDLEEKCEAVGNTAKRIKVNKNLDDNSAGQFESASKIKEEMMSPSKKKKKSKSKERLEISHYEVEESPSHHKKSKSEIHSEDSDNIGITVNGSVPVESHRSAKAKKKHKKHKKSDNNY